MSLKFVPRGPINNIPALVQIMAWHRPATSHYLNQLWLVHCPIYSSIGLNELMLAYHIGIIVYTRSQIRSDNTVRSNYMCSHLERHSH